MENPISQRRSKSRINDLTIFPINAGFQGVLKVAEVEIRLRMMGHRFGNVSQAVLRGRKSQVVSRKSSAVLRGRGRI